SDGAPGHGPGPRGGGRAKGRRDRPEQGDRPGTGAGRALARNRAGPRRPAASALLTASNEQTPTPLRRGPHPWRRIPPVLRPRLRRPPPPEPLGLAAAT